MKGEKQGSPHKQLFWRKDEMAAVRSDSMKLIRVERLPVVMYNLSDDLEETNDLASNAPEVTAHMETALENWEKGLMEPLWTEGATWDTISWMIHQDLMLNRAVRVKNPRQLNQWKQKMD
ncbi:hypothetical protein [Sunxiuqinia sp. sy24]|uniref:hypothetical protein n=1 Tax=Sunxiuqinia sp. sy24 TaxID=3461495 RepID=UPI0040456823